MDNIRLMLGDCLERLRELPDNSVDSVVTDPPYGLSFMGKKWDYDVPSVDVWRECLRVLKPGGHLLAFAGTRTQHRMAVRIEDAGFEIRDMIAWMYGSGFPKSLDVSKALDKAAGVERPDAIKGGHMGAAGRLHGEDYINEGAAVIEKTIPAVVGKGALTRGTPLTESAQQWQGWGTALKPALEPITVARKPLIGTVAQNVLEHGTGAINVDGCRVGADDQLGRWPANLIHDGSDEVVELFPVTTSGGGDKHGRKKSTFCASTDWEAFKGTSSGGDTGSAARFFYCAKASKKDREEGCEGLCVKDVHRYGAGIGEGIDPSAPAKNRNFHPTVKPTDLMRYLCRLVTQPNGVVLDPFMGSGSTGKAAMIEGFQFIGIERDESYFEIARSRIEAAGHTPSHAITPKCT
jgi:site-specific DNA-methyltransferase (adenine-specific)